MFKIETASILDKKSIKVGTRYKIIGEVRYGVREDEFKKLLDAMEVVKEKYLSEVILFDLTELKRWDSLGLRAVIPVVLKLNKSLLSKRRLLIGIIGDVESGLYIAMKGKHPEVTDADLPWYATYEEFLKRASP